MSGNALESGTGLMNSAFDSAKSDAEITTASYHFDISVTFSIYLLVTQKRYFGF